MTELTFDSADQIRHAYILSSPDPELVLSKAKRIAQAAVCRGSGKKPCQRCSACRKVEQGNHPDVRIIERLLDEKGRQKREITVNQVREVSADAIVLPNESTHKVYIFKDAWAMNTEAQNAALKLLEEPPAGVTLILCVQTPTSLLTTVRSRCTELSFSGESEKSEDTAEQLAGEYLEVLSGRNALSLWKWCEASNDISVAEMTEFVRTSAEKFTDMLCGRSDPRGLSQEALFQLVELMERCLDYLAVNGNVKMLFGLISVETVRRTEA